MFCSARQNKSNWTHHSFCRRCFEARSQSSRCFTIIQSFKHIWIPEDCTKRARLTFVEFSCRGCQKTRNDDVGYVIGKRGRIITFFLFTQTFFFFIQFIYCLNQFFVSLIDFRQQKSARLRETKVGTVTPRVREQRDYNGLITEHVWH